MTKVRDDLAGLFERLDTLGSEPVKYSEHPPDSVLRAYLEGRLPKLYKDKDGRPDSSCWHHAKVGLHAKTCGQCWDRLLEMRSQGRFARQQRKSSIGTHTMTKAQFVRQIAKRTKLPEKKTRMVVNEVLNLIIEACATKGEVRFPGFGAFISNARNHATKSSPYAPQKGAIHSKPVCVFKPGERFMAELGKRQ